MRKLAAGAVSLVLGLAPLGAQAPEEAAITLSLGQYVAAYNRGDARRVAEFYEADAIRNFGDQIVVGREAIRARIAESFGGRPDGTTLTLTPSGIRLVEPTVAVVHGEFEVAPGITPSIRGHFIRTLHRVGDRWLIAALQTFSYRQPPADEPSS